jgi:hypothetical protein
MGPRHVAISRWKLPRNPIPHEKLVAEREDLHHRNLMGAR